MLDVTAEQWQELMQSATGRIASIDELQAAMLKREPGRLTQRMHEVDALAQRVQPARKRCHCTGTLASLAGVHLEMAKIVVWAGPWSRAVTASTLLGVQEGYRTLLSEVDTVATAAAIAVGKKAVDFIPVLGPILTGSADACEVANKREANLQAASDELSQLGEYAKALEHLSLTFEALLAVPSEMTVEALIERVTKRKARLLAAHTESGPVGRPHLTDKGNHDGVSWFGDERASTAGLPGARWRARGLGAVMHGAGRPSCWCTAPGAAPGSGAACSRRCAPPGTRCMPSRSPATASVRTCAGPTSRCRRTSTTCSAWSRPRNCDDIVLVGHSYGGMVITGAAAALLERDAQRVRGLVYVDAMVPLPGEGWGDSHSPEIVAARRAAAAAHDNALPPPEPAGFGLSAADARLAAPPPCAASLRHVPRAAALRRHALEALPRLFIDCNQPAYPTIDAMRQRVRELPGWQVVEMATGHFPMVTQPEALVRHLLAFAQG